MTDVIVIGSGAGGATLAWKLADAGYDVLVLEKGPRYERSDYRHDEVHLGIRGGGFVPSVTEDPHVVVDDTRPDVPPQLTTLGWTARCVGGGTAHMGGVFFRFHPDDFQTVSTLGTYEETADWPYGYDELEPYYASAEQLVGVSGMAGGNPFEGFRSTPYPMPPLACHPFATVFDSTCRQLGLTSFPTPLARNSQPYRGRPECSRCEYCAGFGCPTGARGSVQESLVPLIERTGRCEIRPNVMVKEITTDRSGRAKGCIYVDPDGVEHHVRATLICVCCSAVESARLLLLSRSRKSPDGLANGTGLVGRYLQFHASSTGRARFRYEEHPQQMLHERSAGLHRSLTDYYFIPPGASAYPKGGIHCFGFTAAAPIHMARQVAFNGPEGAIWGTELKRRLKGYFEEGRDIHFEVFHDFLPNEKTFVDLDPDVRDTWGLPAARIHLTEPEHHATAGKWLVERGLDVLEAMGGSDLRSAGTGYTNGVMAHGTCRMGADPGKAVLNEFCRSHEIPNLFVVDGSFMPTSGGAPTTLTIIANSLRTADYIIDRARSGELSARASAFRTSPHVVTRSAEGRLTFPSHQRSTAMNANSTTDAQKPPRE